MAPVTRKRKAPEPSAKTSSSADNEQPMIKVVTTHHKHKCPVEKCRKIFKKSPDLRKHYRTHTKVKPYKCTFPSCSHTCAQLSDLITHIRKVHRKSTTIEAKKYVKVQKEVLAEEAKQLGIKEKFTGIVYGEVMENENDANVIMPTLPHFDTIHRTCTGHFICPFSECKHQVISVAHLKIHYRLHCGSDYRPFRCIFSFSCRYAACKKSTVEDHVWRKHNTDLNVADFVESRTDWLRMEDVLFSNAQIVNAPNVQIPRNYKCTFDNCSKKFAYISNLNTHLRTHIQSKPFTCSYPNCDQTAAQKSTILSHIHSVHFNVHQNNFKNLSKEEKQRAEKYVNVNQDQLDNEEPQIAGSRIGPKRKRRKPNNQSTSQVDNESPNYPKVRFEDDTTEDEDDKDELAALLATV